MAKKSAAAPAFAKAGKNLMLSVAMAAAILISIGYAGANDWNETQLKKKIDRLGKSVPDPDKSPLTGDELEALKAIVAVQNAGGSVIIGEPVESDEADDEDEEDEDDSDDEEESDDDESEEDEDEEEDEDDSDDEDEEDGDDEADEDDESDDDDEPAPAPAKKSKKAAKAAKDEDEEPVPAKKSKKAAKEVKPEKAAKSKGTGIVKVGIIDAIVSILKGASSKSPLTKKEITAALAEKFEDRDPEKMAGTVSVQVPYYLRKKGIDVQKSGQGFYIAKSGKVAKEAAEEPVPAKKSKKAAKEAVVEAPAPEKSKKTKKAAKA